MEKAQQTKFDTAYLHKSAKQWLQKLKYSQVNQTDLEVKSNMLIFFNWPCEWSTDLDDNIWRVYYFVELTPNTLTLTLFKHCMPNQISDSVLFISFCSRSISMLLLKFIYRLPKKRVKIKSYMGTEWVFWLRMIPCLNHNISNLDKM